MLTEIANGDFSSHSFWLHVREFAVPPSMIETATARRRAGDWAGACAAAGVDVDLDLRALARTHGQAMAGRVRADLRQLVPDLLRWHLPRIAPDGLLRPGLTVTLARYDDPGPVHLVVRTPRPGRMPVSGSASHCGTAPAQQSATAAIRTRGPVDGSASTCTAICGTPAGPMSCGSGPAETARRHWSRRGSGAASPSTGGWPRPGSCSPPRGGLPVPSACISGPGAGWCWTRRNPAGAWWRPGAPVLSPGCRCCPMRRPGCCPIWSCCVPG